MRIGAYVTEAPSIRQVPSAFWRAELARSPGTGPWATAVGEDRCCAGRPDSRARPFG